MLGSTWAAQGEAVTNKMMFRKSELPEDKKAEERWLYPILVTVMNIAAKSPPPPRQVGPQMVHPTKKTSPAVPMPSLPPSWHLVRSNFVL